MNDLREQPRRTDEITIRFVFSNGDDFVQPLSMDEADGVQDLIDWFRDSKSVPIWTWRVPSAQMSHMLNKAHIMAIDIDGYIEPEGEPSKWYQRLIDKTRTKWLLRG